MAMPKVEQLLHGYRRGHEQLAGSIKLPPRDSELVTRLSDLSGSLAGVPKFASYLTVYPLPSGTYFALGKTWPDSDAARAGCVLTHTLLVPSSVWATLESPRILDAFFTLPHARLADGFDSSLTIPHQDASRTHPSQRHRLVAGSSISTGARDPTKTSGPGIRDQSVLLTFVRRYFNEGKRPLVWFGEDKPEEILWRLLGGLWPKLRTTFSACTMCLQPRTLEDRAFELMFASPTVYSRFLKISPEHFIDSTALRADQREVEIEPWCLDWAHWLFGLTDLANPPGAPDLWALLDEDPTAVRRLFLIEKLTAGTNPTPQVFVGAMDLVESLARDGDSAVASKRSVAERAVRAAREVDDPASGLECLRLIDDRLRRTSFSRVQNIVGPALVDAVAAHTRQALEITIQSFTHALSSIDLDESWFGRGLLKGFRALAQEDPDSLIALRSVPAVAMYVLESAPEVGVAFINAVASRRTDSDMRANLIRWLGDVGDHGRSVFRAALVPILDGGDADILAELLKGLRTEEVSIVLDALWSQTNQLEALVIRDLVVGQIARDHPGETRSWAQRLPRWTSTVAHIFAATYPQTQNGLVELLGDDVGLVKERQAEAVAAFIRRLGTARYPNWLRDLAYEQASLRLILLDGASSESQEVSEQTQRLLREAPDLPVAHLPDLLPRVLEASDRPFFRTLLDVTMLSLIPGCITGAVHETVSQPFLANPIFAPWFQAVAPDILGSLVTRGTRSSESHWFNAWRWIEIAPETVYTREPSLLPGLVDALSRSHSSRLTHAMAETWSRVLRRTRTESRSYRTRLVLCVQALRFSFSNTHLPLGPVVAEVFQDVYTAVTQPICPAETEPLFGIFDWDKGKELRRKLIDSFETSQWPPGDLFLAIADGLLRRKIFKRLMRSYHGQRYAQLALADLERRERPDASFFAENLRQMLNDPHFYEEWD